MPHIHEKIDFAAGAFIVHAGKVLLVNHRLLKMWVPPGGHVELDEEPETTCLREVKEETGLDIEIVGSKPDVSDDRARSLFTPRFMDIHDIDDGHQHVGMIYFARAGTDKVTLADKEHHAIRWFSAGDLDDPSLGLRELVRFYALKAIEELA